MKTRVFITIVAAMMVAACSAFDTNNTPYEGFGPDIVPPPLAGGGGQFQGSYKGEITLQENDCEFLADEVGVASPVVFDVLQSGNLVSVGFEDESEASGDLDGSKVTIVKRDVSNTRIYHIEFTDTGITGDCEYIDSAAVANQIGDSCAKYGLSLTKEE